MNDAALPRPLLAYKDPCFVDGEAARPLRILSEYLAPMDALSRADVHDTVVFFGSARLRPDGPLGRYYQDARELARLVAEWARSLPNGGQRLVVCTGGGGGIMEAANRGAAEAGARTMGLNISLPMEQVPNPYLSPELSFEFHYFFMRKLWFAHLSRALIAFPGGFGTLDELFEVLTLAQTGKFESPPLILLYGPDYWREVIDFEALVRHGTISASDLELFRWVDSPREALDLLRAALATERAGAGPYFAHSRCSCP
ncbi:MAG: TIGR00730 family Rossman fold protein [Planctomycetota bacterium]|nr:MAG: TIGR00730 family Rossman fold protein [Planctomycetota bacterium]